MNMLTTLRRHWGKLVLLVLLAGSLAVVPFVMPAGHSDNETTIYHCPMHPTYTSDKPGDCPICGMRLVPVSGTTQGPSDAGAAPQLAPVAAQAPGDAAGDLYVCPMGAEWKQSGPGRCPKCGMDLVKAERQPGASVGGAAVEGLASVHATGEQLSLAGVRTAEATTGTISSTVRAVGNVVADEARIRQVTTKVAGFVEVLHVNAVGQFVRAGDALFDLYSPELLASQEEYLRARKTAAEFEQSTLSEVRRGGQELAMAARRRLELFDVPQDFLERIEKAGTSQRTITFRAPFSGYVTEKMVLEGQRIEPGMPLMTLTDLSRLWVIAQVYEHEAASAVLGRAATLSPQYDPAIRLSGRISLVYPTMDLESRTIRVRFEVANPRLALKPGMFVNVELQSQQSRGVIVPDSAVIDTGTRQVVFVKAPGGQFDPREVSTGARSDGFVQVKTGLKAGETVAVSANFLLDSESRLRAAIGAAAPAASHAPHK